MTPLRRFLSCLAEVAEHLPQTHPLRRIEAARRLMAGGSLADSERITAAPPPLIERTAKRLRQGALFRLPGLRRVSAKDIAAQRFRLAQLLLGALTEERFGREKEELVAGRLAVEDHRLGRTDTDYRVLNGGGRPIFRINIKFHGTAFEQARKRVGLDPSDCFPLATYKIHQALVRQQEEALPYVFLVLSALGVTARSVSENIPLDYAWVTAISAKLGKRDVEEAVVATLLADAPAFVTELREQISRSEFRVISASRADRVLKERLFERVFALRQRAFTSAYRNAEIDMHFSLSSEMTPIRDFLRRVSDESPQRLTVLLDRGDLA